MLVLVDPILEIEGVESSGRHGFLSRRVTPSSAATG
jgi:hypothetical protein